MTKTTFQRYEMKFLLNHAQFTALSSQLSHCMVSDEHCHNNENYNIYNLYYDTSHNSIIRHSLSKPYFKEKLRLRSYYIPTSPEDKVFLELKKKIGGIVSKRRTVLTLQEAYDFVETAKLPSTREYSNKQVLNEIQFFLKQNEVLPTAYISYKRIAFIGKENKDLRITFDYDIRTRRNDLILEKHNYGTPLLDKEQYLMEVKVPQAVPIWLSRLLSDLEIYKTRFSKYGKEYEKTSPRLIPIFA